MVGDSHSTAAITNTESASGSTEFDLSYYGWRVVLAACFGVMVGFGSLFVYTFTVFCKTARRGIRLEPRSYIQRLRNRRRYSRSLFAAAGPVDRPFWSAPHHPSLHDGVRLWHSFARTVALRHMGVLCDLLRAGCGWKRRRSSGFSRSISTWFQRRLGMALAFVMGIGPRRHDSASSCANHHHPLGLAMPPVEHSESCRSGGRDCLPDCNDTASESREVMSANR